MTKLVSIIIVSYNGKAYLEKCLASLHVIDYKEIEIIVVDNASSDGTVNFIRKYYPHIQILRNSHNVGFAEANNSAMKYVHGEYILFLNNDTVVGKDFLTPLVKALNEDFSIGGAQSKILLFNDKTRYDSIGAFFTYTGFLYHYGYGQKDIARFCKTRYLYTAKGACMIFRRKIIEAIGLFDSDFFAYFEETDFCHRVWLFGYKILYVPESVIYHKMGATSNMMSNSFIQFHSYKNRICSYIKNLSLIELIKLLPIHIVLCEIISIMYLFLGKISLFIAVNKAIMWNVYNLRNTLIKRLGIQKIRKVNDNVFLPQLTEHPSLLYYYYLFQNKLDKYEF